jgi:hypothetical protein
MCKKFLQGASVSGATYIADARRWAQALTKTESRGPGDLENAWRRLESRYGIPFGAFWSLRYRPPKDVAATLYHRLCAAYEAECERQIRRLAHEIEITKQKAGARHAAVASAEALVRSQNIVTNIRRSA